MDRVLGYWATILVRVTVALTLQFFTPPVPGAAGGRQLWRGLVLYELEGVMVLQLHHSHVSHSDSVLGGVSEPFVLESV